MCPDVPTIAILNESDPTSGPAEYRNDGPCKTIRPAFGCSSTAMLSSTMVPPLSPWMHWLPRPSTIDHSTVSDCSTNDLGRDRQLPAIARVGASEAARTITDRPGMKRHFIQPVYRARAPSPVTPGSADETLSRVPASLKRRNCL